MASHTTKTIGELLTHVDQDELVLPEIQRDFVWTKRSVLKLFDSLYRKMPIGHLLVWKAREAVKTKAFHKADLPKAAHLLDSFEGYLLDGQQRLTAIARVRDNDEEYPLQFCFHPGRREQDGEIFGWSIPSRKDAPWYVPVAQLLDERFNLMAFLDELKKERPMTVDETETVRKELERVRHVLDYPVGITLFEDPDYSAATELFIRFNSTGRRLKKSDLTMAELAKRVPGLAGTEMAALRVRWPNFRFTPGFLAQCLLAIQTGRLQVRDPRRAWEEIAPEAVREAWTRLEDAIGQVVAFLTGTMRWSHLGALPSINALVPIIVVIARGGKFGPPERRVAQRWLHLTTVRSEFSGSVYTTIDQILKKLGHDPSIQAVWTATSKSALKKLTWSDFNVSRTDGPAMALLTSMWSAADARDWKDGDRSLNGSVVGKMAQLQVHHFFPRALLRKHEWDDEWIDSVGNYTILSADTNLNVGMEEPATYVPRLAIPERQLEIQCVPLDRELWKVKNYDKFWDARTKLLADRGNEYLGITRAVKK